MGIQVVYNSEEFKAASGESFYEEDSFLFYNDVFMGQRSFFDPNRVWFDNKVLNNEAVEVYRTNVCSVKRGVYDCRPLFVLTGV